MGGDSETLGLGLYDNFHFHGGGYFETLGLGLSHSFHLGGRYYETVFQNRGYSVEFGPKFQPLQQAHASQIVSHILRMWRLKRKISSKGEHT